MADERPPPPTLMGLVMDAMGPGGMWFLALIVLFYLLFSYGASKIAYGQSGSMFVSLLAFLLSPIYYPYYAFVSYTPPFFSTVLGAARRMRR